jgi:GNAT superfamily N-acetyltransferase
MREVGGVLLTELENRFRELGKDECFVSTYPPGYFTPGIDRKAYPALIELLTTRGYGIEKEAISMDATIVLFHVSETVLELEGRLAQSGIRIREFRREDLLDFLGFLETTMPTDWVRVERTNLRKLQTGGFHPYQITVATGGEAIIGYCQFEGSHFGPFGVSDEYQGRGIGTVLLARTLERMRIHGFHDAWVMWTDDVAAKVYGKFGFRETRRFAILKKVL